MRKRMVVTALVAGLAVAAFAQPAFAGACFCVKRNMEGKTVSFECSNQTDGGHAECSTSCQKQGYNGYQLFEDETCNSLYEKIKKERVKLRIRDIQIGPIGIGIDDDKKSKVYGGEATIEAEEDVFEIPKELGGGMHKTDSFGGKIHFRLEQSADNPDLYTIYVTGVDVTADAMTLNGFDTGTLRGDLNPEGVNQGELNTSTGEISLLFSQLIFSEKLPGIPITTHTAYFGTCDNCLDGGEAVLEGDSIYISPFKN